MRSSTEQNPLAAPAFSLPVAGVLKRWNGRLHYYAGLFLLFFVWLFAFTGLLLNHPEWHFDQFWDSRRQTTYEHEIAPPPPGGDLAQARDIMRQLGIRGEIEWTTTRKDASRFNFRVGRPGYSVEIKADLAGNKASMQRIDLNGWGVAHMLHTFTGVRLDDTRNKRDWILTSVWALAMDAVAAGLIFMVLSGYYMWYETKENRWLGLVILGFGFLICGLFCMGLQWLC